MKILFWGTPEFAVPSLRALSEEGHDIVGVVTQPDRPAGRGRELRASAVKTETLDQSLGVLEPESARGDDFVQEIAGLRADLSVVVAYGQILSREVLDVPALGSVNLHASLLPALRGAAPINWSIVRGDTVTGVTVMRMVEQMDAGPILFQTEEPIDPEETASDLRMRLSEIGAEALVEALVLLEAGMIEELEQDESRATYAPKVVRTTARVDWAGEPVAVSNFIRGMDAVPGAWSELEGHPVKLFRPEADPEVVPGARPGTILEADRDVGLLVATVEGAVRIGEVQPPGKQRMDSSAWILGRGATAGQRFE
ncbi:MAG: methionyl-tRNA formyltransferase [Gemmatimonadota bacterium]|nr:methionyl-tRNA formyltransferase [Gemmatimonadota bacterium]